MKKSVIGICISFLCIGCGVYSIPDNKTSTPVVSTVSLQTKGSKKESKTRVSKQEETQKDEKVGNATNSEIKKKNDSVSKDSNSKSTKSKSSTKAESKPAISSEGKKQDSSKSVNSSTSQKDNSTSSSSSSNVSKEPEVKPSEPVKESVVEPTPTPEPEKPSYACPGGINPNASCDTIFDQNHYFATYSSQAEADSAGIYYMNEVMYIGETEITNYSVQAVYRNDHSIAYYGLNLWNNGSLI